MSVAEEKPINGKLSDLFGDGYKLYDTFDTCYDPINSPEVQASIKKCICMFEDSTRLVSLIGLFSTNEGVEEVATEDLKYFMLPYFLGQLSQKLCVVDRKEIVHIAEIYFQDFLQRCEEYNLCEKENKVAIPETQQQLQDGMQQIARSFQDRNAKLRQYQERKELEDEIKRIKIVMDREHIDEETKRNFYLKLLKSCIFQARDEIKSLNQEKQCLEYMEVSKRENSDALKLPKRVSVPLKPIIITRDAVQKAIYGAGYPSLPTMSVDDFYEQRVAEGIFPDETRMKEINKNSLMNKVYADNGAEQDKEDEEKEKLVDEDDEEYLARQRAKDEFKDEHRRGYGNRYNRS